MDIAVSELVLKNICVSHGLQQWCPKSKLMLLDRSGFKQVSTMFLHFINLHSLQQLHTVLF